MNIPLTKPYWGKKEERAAVEALKSSNGTGSGPYNHKLAKKLSKLTKAKFAISTTSCSHGMELAVSALGAGVGDEVIVPSFTMTSTANAVLASGATPVFADIDPTYYNIDPVDIQRKITKKTRGIMIVHYAGMACQMEKILRIAKKYKLWVVEDAAHAIGATYKGKALGLWGDVGVFSFHGTKNVSCGEGGAVITNSKAVSNKMEVVRANGTNRKAFLDGVIEKYSWIEKGSSYYLSDILASILISQIDQIRTINKQRNRIATLYTNKLSKYSKIVQLPLIPKGTVPNWHIYAIKFNNSLDKGVFTSFMKKKGIEALTHYVPLHTSPMGKRLSGGKSAKLAITENVGGSLVRLPIYPGLTARELDYIVKSACIILERL
ncbi:dTDP-4-amino-4,6-dideoxygalactose transaminase [Patescibacteria group bacterium]